ncbi:hypothetical protein E2320_017649, partial [Naja naja]
MGVREQSFKEEMKAMMAEFRDSQGNRPSLIHNERRQDAHHPTWAGRVREELGFQGDSSSRSYIHSEASVSEEEEYRESAFSDEEANEAETPTFTGLFCHQLFKMLLGKAKITHRTKIESESIPSPELFRKVIEGQLDRP